MRGRADAGDEADAAQLRHLLRPSEARGAPGRQHDPGKLCAPSPVRLQTRRRARNPILLVNPYSPQSGKRLSVCSAHAARLKSDNEKRVSVVLSRSMTGYSGNDQDGTHSRGRRPDRRASQPALERAARVAGSLGWALELLICLHEGLPSRVPGLRIHRRCGAHCSRISSATCRNSGANYPGLTVRTKVIWDRPLHEAIIRETLRSEPRLVMKDTHFHSALSRALITNTDWHLIRDCPAPLWLVRGAAWAGPADRGRVRGPVSRERQARGTGSSHPARGASCSPRRLGGEVHAVHCYRHRPADRPCRRVEIRRRPLVTREIAARGSAGRACRGGTAELASRHGIAPEPRPSAQRRRR